MKKIASLSVLLILLSAAVQGAGWQRHPAKQPIDPPGIILPTSTWTLTYDIDFTNPSTEASNMSTYVHPLCGAQGGTTGGNSNNFNASDVYWVPDDGTTGQGAVALKFEYVPNNSSCDSTPVVRNYQSGGIYFYFASPVGYGNVIAVEVELRGTDITGLIPYVTLWPSAPGNGWPTNYCDWGAEDDFFEQGGGDYSGEMQTYHAWSTYPTCTGNNSAFQRVIPDVATHYHKYAVIRNGGVSFFVDGVQQSWQNYTVSNYNFQNYPMTLQMGFGNYTDTPILGPLPAYVYLRHIRIWCPVAGCSGYTVVGG